MEGFDWTYVVPLLIVAGVALALIVRAVIRDVREARAAETPEQPAYTYPLTPEPTGPRCRHGDGRPAVDSIHGWLLCDEHAAAIRNRKPYDQERSAS